MKTGTIVGWMIVNRHKDNCGFEPSRSTARWVAKLLNRETAHSREYGPFRVCKVEVVH